MVLLPGVLDRDWLEGEFFTTVQKRGAAIIKAREKGDAWLADRIYSGVPAGLFGKTQTVEVGHMSGLSNVLWWLEVNGHQAREGLAERILAEAKSRNRVLSDAEVHAIIADTPA